MKIFLFIFIIIIVLFGINERRIYKRRIGSDPNDRVARKRFNRRFFGIFLLLMEIALLLFYQYWFESWSPSPLYALLYLGSCLILALVIFAVVLRDIRATAETIIHSQGEFSAFQMKQLEREVHELLKKDIPPIESNSEKGNN